jgi:threonine/homoserine/homoserine lactone efflux protein
MWAYLGLGLSMGLSAGISPGPLQALVITASLRSGMAGGLRVALAPLLTDSLIILLAVWLIGQLPPQAFRWVGTVGGLVVIGFGIETFRSARKAAPAGDVAAQAEPRKELWRGAVVNALNPHPYLFWATVGGPALVSGWRISPWHALAFVVSFYVLLVGSMVFIAWIVSSQTGTLPLAWYRRLLVGSGFLVLAMGGWLIWRSWVG